MPRFWFIAKDDATIIQVHRNAFLFNWRLRAEEYPRFERVFETFRNIAPLSFSSSRKISTAKIEQPKYQLNFVNVFEDVPYWSRPEDTPKIRSLIRVRKSWIEKCKTQRL